MPPQPRIATTHELMLPYAADLLRQKAKGASHGQMISWLHTQGVMVNMGEISSFWPYLEQAKQKQQQQPAQQKQEQEPQTQQPGRGTGSPVPIIGKNPVHPVNPVKKAVFTSASAPVLLAYVFDLIGLRAAGKSDAELIVWLRTNKNLGTSHSEITKVFDYYKEYQGEIEEQLQQAWERHLERERGRPLDPEKDQGENGNPPPNSPPVWHSLGDDGSVGPLRLDRGEGQGEVSNPVNSLSTPASAEYDISEVMADYKILVARQVARDKVAPEPNLESQKVTERMVRTLMMYKHSLERREERLAALKIKKTDHERKISKAATASQEEARETAADRKAPKDFDNTAFIKVMRDESLKDANTPEIIALTDKMIMEADAQARAAGMKIPLYVPSEPLPTAQPSPPREERMPIIGSAEVSNLRAADLPSPLRLDRGREMRGRRSAEVSNLLSTLGHQLVPASPPSAPPGPSPPGNPS